MGCARHSTNKMARVHIPVDVERRVRLAAGNRCGFCQSPQYLVMGRLEIEHLIPLAHGGTSDESNLWLACSICNGHKGEKIAAIDPETKQVVRFFNPRLDEWQTHFGWSDDGLRIIGKTPIGRATVVALHLSDDPIALLVRSLWVEAGWHPPID